MKKVLCKVGNDLVYAYPGEDFTFGQGGNCWGPIPISELKPGMDTEGLFIAIPVEEEQD